MKAWCGMLLLGLSALIGCSPAEKEKEPVVTVQTQPTERQSISQFVSAEAVVFPLRQATVSPKITSTVADFKVQRGARVQQGQLLASLENKDLAAQAVASKGDFDQADATYAITVNAGVPQQIQKAELDAAAAKSAFEAAQKVFDSRKDLFQQVALQRRDFDRADVAAAPQLLRDSQRHRRLGNGSPAVRRRFGRRESTDPDCDGCVCTRRESSNPSSRRSPVESRRLGANQNRR